MEFHIDTHEITGEPIVEVWNDGEFVAGIYSHENGLKIVSKYIDGITQVINFSLPSATHGGGSHS